VLGAEELIGGRSFAVVNADDIYGVPPSNSCRHLRTSTDHALVSYQLGGTVVTSGSVDPGHLRDDDEGWLRTLVERRQVTRHQDGTITADDGLEPSELPGEPDVDEPVGFTSAIWPFLHDAVNEVHLTWRPTGSVLGDGPASKAEVLLPRWWEPW